jgi:hypothetical protein
MNPVLPLIRSFLAIVGAVVLNAGAALALDATDVADGFTSSVTSRARVKYGARRTLDVANKQPVYVQFELDGLSAGVKAGDIRKATLRLWINKVVKAGTLRLSTTGDGTTLLDETTIANATTPVPGTTLGTLAVAKTDVNTFVTIDVTSAITALTLSPASRPAFVIDQSVADDGTSVRFDSKENIATGHYPQLQLLVGSDSSPYGNGSAGLTVISGTNVIIEPLNAQFTDLTINAGATVFVESGTVIRCTGAFTNNGTISVAPLAKGGNAASAGFSGAAAHPGLAVRAAGNATEVGSLAQSFGGIEGQGFAEFGSKVLANPGPFGGGAGGGASFQGGNGGGTLSIRAIGAVNNGGTILAKGGSAMSPGDGGGGGGIVVLASRTNVIQAGTIDCGGGSGADGDTVNAAGGGGGGGVILLLAPVVTPTGGTLTASGGVGGTSVQITATTRRSGGGGGACAGNGGAGGMVNAGLPATATNASAGQGGQILTTLVDPGSLLH